MNFSDGLLACGATKLVVRAEAVRDHDPSSVACSTSQNHCARYWSGVQETRCNQRRLAHSLTAAKVRLPLNNHLRPRGVQ